MLVSIIIPAYNAEAYLNQCLDAVLKQSYKNFECICVNDKSSDGTKELLEKYCKRDDRIIVLNNDENLGAASSRFEGLKRSKGEWIAFIDADDIIDINYLSILVDNIEESVDVVIGKRGILGETIIESTSLENYDKETINEKADIVSCIFTTEYPIITFWGKIIRKTILLSYEYEKHKEWMQTTWFEDGFVMPIVYLYCRKAVLIDDELYYYRVSENSLSRNLKNYKYSMDQALAQEVLLGVLYENNVKEFIIPTLRGLLLSSIKTYYCANADETIRNKSLKLFKKYYKICKKNDFDLFNRMIFFTFNMCPALWNVTAGNLYFKLINVKH